ncbi:MAG TPA: ABC transporter ATP-binding protein [Croceibacterium sp.]|nr:ABC transporter ATP-binding protein [Croceibacterium sp.]
MEGEARARRSDEPAAWRVLLAAGGARLTALVLALTFVSSVTEGLGLMLLVPLLGSLGGEAASGAASGILAGYRPGLPVLLLVFVGLVALRVVASFLRGLAAFRLEVRIVDGLRDRAMAALLAADWRALSRRRRSDLRAMLISSIDRASSSVNYGLTLINTGFSLAAACAAGLALSWRFMLAGMVVGAAIHVLFRGLRRSARQLGSGLNRGFRVIHARLDESLDGLRLIKSFEREARTRAEVAAAFSGFRGFQHRYFVIAGRARIIRQVVGAALLAALVWVAFERWGYPLAVLLPLVALFARAVPLLGTFQDHLQYYAHDAPAVEEAARLIAEVEAQAEPNDPALRPPTLERSIRLERVDLDFGDGRFALRQIDLEIPALSTFALLGHSGAGKSTLADILGGLLGPDSGRVLIDGVELDAGARRAWRSQVAYMQQEAVLFAGSVRDNLRWARPEADEAALRRALERAAAQFAFALPGGIDCDLGEGGRQLSGGERQRIALARALLREPRLLILDEATSAIDAAAEREVAAAVERLKGSLTIVVIGHRGLLTDLAERRITLEHGRLVAAA